MRLAIFEVIVLTGLHCITCADTLFTPGEFVPGDFKSVAEGFMGQYCLDCHDEDTSKGNLSLQDLGPVDETNTPIWKSIWAQVMLQEMPPPKKKLQPEIVQRLQFSDWIVQELKRVMNDAGGFSEHLDPQKGNFLDHDLLFGPLPEGIQIKPSSSEARLWRVTPQEHITRLNELINTEPEFDSRKPGLRTRGDVVPTNHGGELKLYFGVDRIIKWQGGTVAYATSVKSVPVVLSSARKHGLENYPDLYTVNSAEATQIIGKAEDILRYMAYGPLSIANSEQITDDPDTYKMEGDIRGLPTALVYSTQIVRPLTPVHDLMRHSGVNDERLRSAVDYLFEALTFRPPTSRESDDYCGIVKDSIIKLGKEDGVILGLSSIFLDRDALFRSELVEYGTPDSHGRVMLQDWELGMAVNHALRYIKPDQKLRQAVMGGRMRTRGDVQREVQRMLADERIRKPRILQFFRDYFDHDLGGYICKDTKALGQTGVSARGAAHYRAMFDATASTDRLIELILQADTHVLKELLTTQKVVATKNDRTYFGRKHTPEERQAALAAKKLAEAEQAKKDAIELEVLEMDISDLNAILKKHPEETHAQRTLNRKKKQLDSVKNRIKKAKRGGGNSNIDVAPANLNGPKIYARVSHRSFGNGSLTADRMLATAPEGQRMGILTHPAWLVSHSDAMDNHAILRGRWVRERLLGGGIPDVPITVDAMLPDEPRTSLRERMRVTREAYCWTCHAKMDPLGLPFEMYNHAGLYRTTEWGEPVNTEGEIMDSGDPRLDGSVVNAIEMIEKLAASERVEQVFVRHAFRFWMGRNETLHDAPILKAAHKAYRDNGGSMNALITSLITSDAFIYREVER